MDLPYLRDHDRELDEALQEEELEAGQDVQGTTLLVYPRVTGSAPVPSPHMDWLDRQAALVMQSESLRRRMRQTEIWVDREGRVHELNTIEPEYARNIMRWLERRAEFMYQGACAWWLFAPEAGGDMAQQTCEEEQRVLFEMTSREWLLDQPLWRALDHRSKLAPDETTRRRAVQSTLRGRFLRRRFTTTT